MTTINSAGYFFYWPEGSPFIEVFRKGDPSWSPFEVIWAGDESRSQSTLSIIANESREYANV